jgi:aryl-alcohol dehydrogenase-like predicted oxidoreductase
MNHRKLGRTGLIVSELALGGLFVSSLGGAFEQARAAVRRALELGVNYIDTAPGYFNSEEVLGRILAGEERPLVISTKVGGRPVPFDARDKDALFRSMEESLRLLGREQVDIVMVHEPDRPGQYDWWADRERFYGPVMEALEEAKRAGLVRFTGLGGTTVYEMAAIVRTGQFDVVLTAFNYNLLWREALQEIVPAAREQEMGIVIGSPLQQGVLARRFDEEVRSGARWLNPPRRRQFLALYDWLDETGLTITEAAVRFVLSNPDVSCVLMGARSPEEVEANVAAVERGPLPAQMLERLEEIAAMVPFRPCAEPFFLPFGKDYAGPGPA